MNRIFWTIACSTCWALLLGCQHARTQTSPHEAEHQPKQSAEQIADREDPGASRTIPPRTVDLTKILEPGLCGLFGQLKPGLKEYDGIPFLVSDARIPVRPGTKQSVDLPGISCEGLHFLHFTEQSGGRIGSYTLKYVDGEQAEIPLRGGINIQDWWKPGQMLFAAQAESDVFMNGQQPQAIAFWRFSVRNPRPNVPVVALEIVNSDTLATINLIALTITGSCDDRIGDVPVWAEEIDEGKLLLAILRQPGPAPGKERACEDLARMGTLESVPLLASYLDDEQLSHAARLALASMSYPEAKAALRDALGRTAGAIKAGIIESLGTTRDVQHIPLLTPLLRDEDPLIATSAALALGRIGSADAIAALKTATRESSGRLRIVAMDALLSCAEKLAPRDSKSAYALYTWLFNEEGPEQTKAAAYRGIICTSGGKAPELISAALSGDDPNLWGVALSTVREIPGTRVTQTSAELLGRAPRAVLPGLVEAVAQRGDKGAASALVPLLSDPEPAIAGPAIQALALIGDASTAPALVKTAAHADDAHRAAALQALTQIDDPKTAAALLNRLKMADAAETVVIAKVLGLRKDKGVRSALRQLLRSHEASVRMAAAQALAEVGEAKDAELLCHAMERAENDAERASAKRALGMLGKRIDTPPPFVDALLAALKKNDVKLHCALLDLCAILPNPEFLHALDNATADANAEIQDAAIRALAESENPQALPRLVALLDTTNDLTHRVLTFRGVARLATNNPDIDEATREASLLRALAVADRPEEKKLFLGALGACPTIDALKAVEHHLASDDVVEEAVLAWGQIAKPLLSSRPEEVRAALPAVLARARAAGVSRNAMHAANDVKKALAAVPAPANQVRFERIAIDRQFRSEGVAVADINRDGNNDILAGDVWYEAPEWKLHEIRPAKVYDPNTGYSKCFANFTADVDEDGWPDSIIIGFPGAPAHWLRNPGEGGGHWQEYLLATSAAGETPLYGDLLGDGKPVPVFATNSRVTWFRPAQDKTAPWLPFPISHSLESFAQFGHGLGMGDVNGDGRIDIISTEGWWQAPEDRTRPDWAFREAKLGPACANMIVYDVDGDGDNDIITSSAHEYGVWWFEQRQENGAITFEQHEIHKGISQTHALILADINNDGLQDLVTGKRYYAHCGHDPGCHEPAILCWFELQRPEPGKVTYQMHEIDADSGVGTQFEVCDFDEDGLLDVATSNKKGVHLFLQRRSQ